MNSLLEQSISCPYCGESIAVLIDTTDLDQQYIEDCQVCCRPINFSISTTVCGDIDVAVFSDDENY